MIACSSHVKCRALNDLPRSARNFDRSGSFGPQFVTADELPPGAWGLRLQTKLNGRVMQDANTRDMIFDVATLVNPVVDGE